VVTVFVFSMQLSRTLRTIEPWYGLTRAPSRHSVRCRFNTEAINVSSDDGGDAEAVTIGRDVSRRERDGVVVAARAVVDGDGHGVGARGQARGGVDADDSNKEGKDRLGLHLDGCVEEKLKACGRVVWLVGW
jgi:hypothetical protein